VGNQLLLRQGAAGAGTQGVEGRGSKCPGGPGGLAAPGQMQRGRPVREVLGGYGESGCLKASTRVRKCGEAFWRRGGAPCPFW
jgi:hypothetical protein